MPQPSSASRGQALVEFAVVVPMFMTVLLGIVVIGMGVFYQQQLANGAREAARYAAIHSATARCPTVGHRDPRATMLPASGSYARCDSPENGWRFMTPHGRSAIFGLDRSQVLFTACWSGYQEIDPATGLPDPSRYDAPPPAPPPGYDVIGPMDSAWVPCTMDDDPAVDPAVDPSSVECEPGLANTTVDQASSISEAPGRIVANQVTVMACWVWRPPLAGFLLIPSDVTLRAVVTEPIQRQQ